MSKAITIGSRDTGRTDSSGGGKSGLSLAPSS